MTNQGSQILKVNHAGENGAVQIYAGQLLMARLTAPSVIKKLYETKSHEERHRSIFERELKRRGAPRCKSYLLCGIGGYALGLMTGLLGKRAIAATTVAIERVVLNHLHMQMSELHGKDETAYNAIAAIVSDEQQHHDQAAAQLDVQTWWLRALSQVISLLTEAVIWLGMRL